MLSSDGLRPAPGGGRPPALGKLASRLEALKNPWRRAAGAAAPLELSHNEAARLATDALLEGGEAEYRRVLAQERELSFLSPREIRYIGRHKALGPDPHQQDGGTPPMERDFGDFGESGDGDAVSELTSGTYFPMMSDEEPPLLELGWPQAPARFGPSETQIYFQRDRAHNVKDIIRSLISKANKVIALVMDVFTDVDLLCDLMEASNKRRVPVYVLLDEKNLSSFTDMCSALDVQNSHLSNMRIRSVCGDTYCTKSGKKFTGQVLEKFMIIDCEEVVAGSYSFTWLSAHVHSNMVMHFSGRIADSFDREFRCLYADSQIIERFFSAEEEEGMLYYPSLQGLLAPAGAPGGNLQRDRVCSENSSSQSSSSVSSVKAAPGMASNNAYKLTQKDKKEASGSAPLSPERRGSPGGEGGGAGGRGSSNGGGATYGQPMGVDWTKPSPADAVRSNMAAASSKFQALGLYDKPSMFHGSPAPPMGQSPTHLNTQSPAHLMGQSPAHLKGQSPAHLNTQSPAHLMGQSPSHLKGQSPSHLNTQSPAHFMGQSPAHLKAPPTSSQFLNKLSDFFQPPTSKDRDSYSFRRTPSPYGAPWGLADHAPPEPNGERSPPPPSPGTTPALISRQDQKRMTLGHSKLDLVNQYNKMKSKQVYSRFELKSSD